MFDGRSLFDVFVEYAKADIEDILHQITVTNRGPEAADIHCCRRVVSQHMGRGAAGTCPELRQSKPAPDTVIELNLASEDRTHSGKRWLHCDGCRQPLFTENETNMQRLYGVENRRRTSKMRFNDYVVQW